MVKLQPGDDAPKFNVDGFNLDDFKGSIVVLYFYPKDNTPGCTLEAKDFANHKKSFDEVGAKILGVSKDTRKSHDNFTEKCGLNFDLISDDQDLSEKYGMWVLKSMYGKSYMGISRSTFLIDREGKIAFIWPSVKVNGHAEEVLNKIKELKL